ncbi:MAG: hypothetical protein ACI8XX_000568 [Polaribacter sp.]|jgi:hypothetical protein
MVCLLFMETLFSRDSIAHAKCYICNEYAIFVCDDQKIITLYKIIIYNYKLSFRIKAHHTMEQQVEHEF